MSARAKALLLCAWVWSQPVWSLDWCGTLLIIPGQIQSNFMIVDGVLRGYGLFVPRNVKQDMPLSLDFHGFGSNHRLEAQSSCWRSLADREGAVVAYPQGRHLVPAWASGDYCCPGGDAGDAAFARMLASCLSRNLPKVLGTTPDAGKVYAVGLSNGGAMAGRLACESSDVFSGVAVTSQSFPFKDVGQCRQITADGAGKPAVPVVEARGTMDVIVPYVYSWGWSVPARHSVERWRRAMGCLEQPVFEDICDRPGSGPDCEYGHSWCQSYYQCEHNAVVSQCTLIDGHLLYENDHDYSPCDDAWFEFQRYHLVKPRWLQYSRDH
ncbi:MAG: PHB depolymerase family esterase [Pseudomonadota bacterium]|nr:PHB depolymerase family esterase [Pseudomonadota bacterium]